MSKTAFNPDTIKVGISSCLLGQEVRFDGGHKRSPFCTDTLGGHVDFVPVCPEVGAGLGLPRPTIRLEVKDGETRAVRRDGVDVTAPLVEFGARTLPSLDYLSGYIFCARSPSCGMERVKVYQPNGHSRANGTGVYADALMRRYPNLPVEENGRLNDLTLRENFVTRLYAYHHWKSVVAAGVTAKALIDFHSDYKYLLLAHHPHSYQLLGRLLSNLSGGLDEIVATYELTFMQALRHVATRNKQVNVLQHLHGYFKDRMNARQRAELMRLIEQYRGGLLPLLAPLTLIEHYLGEHPNDYIARQKYLDPHPRELALRYGI